MSIIERFRPLFYPRGIVISGVSTHPGKWGFLFFHHLLRSGYTGKVFPLNRDGAEVLGRQTYRSMEEVPLGEADLLILCTPTGINEELLRAASARGVRAAFIAAAGYAESGSEGRALEERLVAAANECGVLMAGPNGQGLISTGASMCAQMVAPYPLRGHISIVSQSGNLVSSFGHYANRTGIGISKAISCGNSAQVGLDDFLDYLREDEDTRVVFAYLEGVRDGRKFLERARRFSERKPLVVLKGGVTDLGQVAASSHTGSLANDGLIFDGACRQAGILRVSSLEEAFETSAAFATQPLPRGNRTVVLTVAGGWGVLCTDACVRAGLQVIPLPDDLKQAINEHLPPRWSQGNPIDLAGGEVRDTIPKVLELVTEHEEVDAVIYLGIGIQAENAAMMKTGPYYKSYGLDRIVAFHERQDSNYARAAIESSRNTGKPVLCVTELAFTDASGNNPAPRILREGGMFAFPSVQRAVQSLSHLMRYSAWRQQNG